MNIKTHRISDEEPAVHCTCGYCESGKPLPVGMPLMHCPMRLKRLAKLVHRKSERAMAKVHEFGELYPIGKDERSKLLNWPREEQRHLAWTAQRRADWSEKMRRKNAAAKLAKTVVKK